MISKRAHIGWTTNGHTGEDVVLYVYSPTGDRPTGVIEKAVRALPPSCL
nr:alkaline phosphatase [Desulfofundulus sp. TPOSR]